MKMRFCIALVCAALLGNSLAPLAQAEIIGTSDVIAAESTRTAQLDGVRSTLDRAEVRARLADLGVDPQRLDARIAALTDAELARLSQRLDQEPAGGVLAVLGIVLVVLIVLEYTGAIDIFKKVP